MNLDRRNFLRAAVPASAAATGLLNGVGWQPLLAQTSTAPARVPEAPLTEKTVAEWR
jgi:hypothetical protein